MTSVHFIFGSTVSFVTQFQTESLKSEFDVQAAAVRQTLNFDSMLPLCTRSKSASFPDTFHSYTQRFNT